MGFNQYTDEVLGTRAQRRGTCLLAAYDLIGFNPRGVGQGAPLRDPDAIKSNR